MAWFRESALDDAQKELRNGVEQAERLQSAGHGPESARSRSPRRRWRRTEANLKQLEEQLSYTDIVSPIDGVVLSRDVEMGDAVSSILVLGSSATLVMTLGDTSSGLRKRQGG